MDNRRVAVQGRSWGFVWQRRNFAAACKYGKAPRRRARSGLGRKFFDRL